MARELFVHLPRHPPVREIFIPNHRIKPDEVRITAGAAPQPHIPRCGRLVLPSPTFQGVGSSVVCSSRWIHGRDMQKERVGLPCNYNMRAHNALPCNYNMRGSGWQHEDAILREHDGAVITIFLFFLFLIREAYSRSSQIMFVIRDVKTETCPARISDLTSGVSRICISYVVTYFAL
jgi:hypothetical protein